MALNLLVGTKPQDIWPAIVTTHVDESASLEDIVQFYCSINDALLPLGKIRC